MLPEGLITNTPALSIESFANAAPMAVLVLALDGNCVYSNTKWCELTKTSRDMNKGRGWLAFFESSCKNQILEFLVSDLPTPREASLLTAEGTTKINITFTTLKPGGSLKLAWVQEIKDDSAKTAKAFTFDHRVHLIETVLDSTISMISVLDKHLNVIFYNQQVEAYTKVSKDGALGRNVFDAFPHLRDHKQFNDGITGALRGETIQSGVEESSIEKGKYLESFYIPLRNEENEIEGVIIKVRDRTVDTQLQKQLLTTNQLLEEQNKELIKQAHFIQSLFDSTIDVIAVIDRDLRYLSINKQAVERYGFTKEEIEGKNILDLFPSVKNTGMHRDILRALQGEFVYDLAYTSEVLNRSRFENYYVPLRDENDAVYAVMIIGHDITAIMNANEQLKISNTTLIQKNRDLERSNNDLEQFAYVASHDLQEPIRKIATYSNKLLTRSKDELTDETALYLQRISNSTRRMYELINGLLAYSRLTREEDLFRKTSIDAVVRQLMIDFDLKIKDKKAVISIQNTLPELEAIPVQMNQLFTNLISNSLKFAKADVTPVIQIAALDLNQEQVEFYNLDPRRKYVTLFYVDNGIGFDQQFAEKIFDLFQRLHEKNKYEGSGIGLAICKKIITNHHGLITAYSEEGKGVTFQMILPYSQKLSVPLR